YAFYDKSKKTCHCTACQGKFSEKATGAKIKDKDSIKCPLCGATVTVMKRKAQVSVTGRLTMIQNVNEKQGVQRHFVVTVEWANERKVYLEEIIRLMMLRNQRHACKIYYEDGWNGWTGGNIRN
ncbi:MAG: hypothetical protein IJC59_04890, partial [Lachnospiraceae bacterium]|nr:hypothetical protein [Lachnospiraceae bacterium]